MATQISFTEMAEIAAASGKELLSMDDSSGSISVPAAARVHQMDERALDRILARDLNDEDIDGLLHLCSVEMSHGHDDALLRGVQMIRARYEKARREAIAQARHERAIRYFFDGPYAR